MKNFIVAFKVLIVFTLITGLVYPVLVTISAKIFFARQANGSLIIKEGKVLGSELIGQNFKDKKYFWGRPSATDYATLPSGASNLGPTSKDFIAKVEERKKQGLSEDMLFSSGSGLDPHISPQSAFNQISRIAKERQLNDSDLKRVNDLVSNAVEKRQFGIFGEERVNVLMLNLSLDSLLKKGI